MNRAALCSILFLFSALHAAGSSLAPVAEETIARRAAGICHGRVESLESFEQNGCIRTRATISVVETVKGTLPEQIEFVYDGGKLHGRGMDSGAAPALRTGEERLFIFSIAADGSLVLDRGSAGARKMERDASTGAPGLRARLDLRRMQRLAGNAGQDLRNFAPPPARAGAAARGMDQSASGTGGGTSPTGLVVDGYGIPARFIDADRGEAIHYVIDDTVRPAGLSRAQVQAAVEQALAAWAAVTSLTFSFDGFETFGQSAGNIQNDDGRLRIQTFNGYGAIGSLDTLGIGGRYWTTVESGGDDSGSGGQVAGQEFHRSTNGFVVMNHQSPGNASAVMFAEVMCHEIGHALGMAHSSENPAESNATLRDAIMYFTAHNDGRGARLGSWDTPVIRKAYPHDNTPPWCDLRYVTLLTGSAAPVGPGLNEVTIAGYDRQTASSALTVSSMVPATSGTGVTWSRTGSVVKMTPVGNYGDNTVAPSSGNRFDSLLYRFGDGVHCSPWTEIRVVQIRQDTFPSGGDGMPNDWMVANFGSENPAAGPNRGAAQDWDGDGFTNLQEYRLGTDPKTGNSRFQVTGWTGTGPLSFPAFPWRTYMLETSTDLLTWQPLSAVTPATAAGTFPAAPLTSPRGYRRVRQLQ